MSKISVFVVDPRDQPLSRLGSSVIGLQKFFDLRNLSDDQKAYFFGAYEDFLSKMDPKRFEQKYLDRNSFNYKLAEFHPLLVALQQLKFALSVNDGKMANVHDCNYIFIFL